MTLSSTSTISDIISEINKLQRTISALENGKRAARNVTGARAVPSSATNLIQGDIVGDYLYNGNDYYELSVVNSAGILKWVQIKLNASI